MNVLPVLWDEGGLVVIDKPPGLPTTGRTLDDPRCAQFVLARQLRRPVWAVHQLDADTSGVTLFVRRRSLVAPTAEALRLGHKTYLAVVHGAPSEPVVEVRAPIARGPAGPRLHADGDPAWSTVVLQTTSGAFSALAVRLHTGRTHQVRLHLVSLGLPLVGERRYLTPPCALHPRHALHAAQVVLAGGATLVAALPADLTLLSRRLGLDLAS